MFNNQHDGMKLELQDHLANVGDIIFTGPGLYVNFQDQTGIQEEMFALCEPCIEQLRIAQMLFAGQGSVKIRYWTFDEP